MPDELFNRVKRLAKRTGRPFRALVEEGLRHVLGTQQARADRYELPDCSVGDANGVNPLDALSWLVDRAAGALCAQGAPVTLTAKPNPYAHPGVADRSHSSSRSGRTRRARR